MDIKLDYISMIATEDRRKLAYHEIKHIINFSANKLEDINLSCAGTQRDQQFVIQQILNCQKLKKLNLINLDYSKQCLVLMQTLV